MQAGSGSRATKEAHLMAARQSAINTGHYDGQPAPTAGARGLLHASWLRFASDEGGASDGCPSECDQHRSL
jgi:hypothetical protein